VVEVNTMSIVKFLPNAFNLKNILESILLTAEGAQREGSWDFVCSEYTSTTNSSISTPPSSNAIWRCTSTTYPGACCFVHEKNVLTGPYNEKDRSRSLEQFVVHDKSDRFKEKSTWSIQGYSISIKEMNLSFRVGVVSLVGTTEIYDGVVFSLECIDINATRVECLQRIKDVCQNIEEAMKQHYNGSRNNTSNNSSNNSNSYNSNSYNSNSNNSSSSSSSDSSGSAEDVVELLKLSNIDPSIMSNLQSAYSLPENDPIKYEALQMLEIIQHLEKEKRKM
jgi:hypothetical protein